VHGIDIGLRVNGDGFDIEFFAGADDAEGDFTTVGDEDFFKHGEMSGGLRAKGVESEAEWQKGDESAKRAFQDSPPFSFGSLLQALSSNRGWPY
jgi:hypothetical protein